MGSHAPYAAAVVGLVVTLAVGFAMLEGMLLETESVPVALAAGAVAGLAVGAVVLLAVGGVGPGTRHVAIAVALFGWLGFLVFLVVGFAEMAAETGLIAAVAVGGLAAVAVYIWLRQNDTQQVQAVTMR